VSHTYDTHTTHNTRHTTHDTRRRSGGVPESDESDEPESESEVSLSVEETSTLLGFSLTELRHWNVRCPTTPPQHM
jgi:hypothetical protein